MRNHPPVKKTRMVLILLVILLAAAGNAAYATMPTFDAVNATLNELRNVLMQSQFAQDIAVALDQLERVKAQYQELIRFNSGLDSVFKVFVGDSYRNLFRSGNTGLRDAFGDFGGITPNIEILGQASSPQDIRTSLEAITGAIPESSERPYIPFEEMQVVEGFQFAQEIRKAGDETRDAAQSISEQAQTASPKGAARLGTEALSRMMILSQQNQEVLAKILELQAVQVEQVSREEKRLESERLKYLEDAGSYLAGLQEAR